MSFFFTENEGKYIKNTDYYKSEQANQGLMFLSWNSGAGRLLIPESVSYVLNELKNCCEVEIEQDNNAFQLFFYEKNNNDNPFLINIEKGMSDAQKVKKGKWQLLIYTQEGLFKEIKAEVF